MDDLLYLYINISEFQRTLCTNSAWNKIKAATTTDSERFVPKISIPKKTYPRWFNAEIRHKLNCVRTIRKRNRSHTTTTNQRKL